MPTPTIHWAVDAAGDWATAADWNLHRLPNSTDDVSIDTAHAHFITHSTGTDIVHTLTVGNDFFTVSGGSLTIKSTASFAHQLKVSGGTLKFDGAATTVHLVQSNSTISGPGTLTVTGTGGPATFSANLLQTGSGKTVLQGVSTFSGAGANVFGVDGGRTLQNQGVFTITEESEIALGANPFGANSGSGTLSNGVAGTIEMQGDNGAIAGLVGSGSRFLNAGTLVKTGGGRSIIGVDTKDNGSIEAVSGTLEFFLAITGNGSLTVDTGAVLKVDSPVAATLNMTFNGGTLNLADPATFAATIHGFAAGDTIDLYSRTATSAALGAGDTLVIKNGTTTIATLQLAGNHTGDTFHVASDGASGTNITVTPGPAHAARFVSAMAALGAGGGGMWHAMNEMHTEARQPMLSSASRAHFA